MIHAATGGYPAGYDGLLATGCRELQAQRVVARFSCRAAG